MVSNIILGSAIKNNLLSIINTQRLVDRTSLRLATGLKVNSALENPKNFFTAAALNNRAEDLKRLLDHISLNIRTVQEANNGVTAISALVQQGQAIAQQAVDLIAASEKESAVFGTVDLSGVADLTSLSGINAGDRFRFRSRDPDTITYNPGLSSVIIAAGMSGSEFVSAINALNSATDPVIKAALTEQGFLQISAVGGQSLNIIFDAVGAVNDITNLAVAAALGYGGIAQLLEGGTVNNEVQFTLSHSRTLTSFRFFNIITGGVARRTDTISNLEGENNTALFDRLNNAFDQYEIGINGETRESIVLNNVQTIGGFISAINGNSNLNEFIEADFIDATGQITIKAIDPSVESIESAMVSDVLAIAFFGWTVSWQRRGAGTDADSVHLGSISGTDRDRLLNLENDYNQNLSAIDGITEDAAVRGINLLAGDDLTSFFNEDLSNFLLIEGVDLSATNIGLQEANFKTLISAQNAKDNSFAALKEVRSFGNTLANSLYIIETRQDFSKKTINTLESGADDLVNADLNEEGANILALQTRQAIGTVALSLAATQSNSILRIFS